MRGVRVSSGLSPFLGWIVCVSCPVAVAIVYFESCLPFSVSGSFALLYTVRDRCFECIFLGGWVGGGDLLFSSAFPPFLFISWLTFFLKFMFRWKAVVGGLGNNCCRLLFFMRSHLLCFGARRVIVGRGSGPEPTVFCNVWVARCLYRGGFLLCFFFFSFFSSTDFFFFFFFFYFKFSFVLRLVIAVAFQGLS